VPNYLRARCIFFKKFLEDKKNNGKDLNYKSFYMGLTLDDFMAWKAEEMTMNTSSPRVAKSRDLVADFKKGIKRDPSLLERQRHYKGVKLRLSQERQCVHLETHPCSLLSNI
jgi:hypothetical protein